MASGFCFCAFVASVAFGFRGFCGFWLSWLSWLIHLLFVYICLDLSVCLSIDLFIYLSIYLSIYISIFFFLSFFLFRSCSPFSFCLCFFFYSLCREETKQGRKEGRKEARKQGSKEARKEGSKQASNQASKHASTSYSPLDLVCCWGVRCAPPQPPPAPRNLHFISATRVFHKIFLLAFLPTAPNCCEKQKFI